MLALFIANCIKHAKLLSLLQNNWCNLNLRWLSTFIDLTWSETATRLGSFRWFKHILLSAIGSLDYHMLRSLYVSKVSAASDGSLLLLN